MSRTPEHDFLRAVGTPLPRKEQRQEEVSRSPAPRTPGSQGIAQRGSVRRDSRASSLGAADKGHAPAEPARKTRTLFRWITSGAVAGAFVVLAILLLHQRSYFNQQSLPHGPSDAQDWWEESTSLPQLPEGSTCGPEDQAAELRKLLWGTQQKLRESQDLLRQTGREARSAAGLKKQVEACEGKLREAASGQAHQKQELSQKLHQVEQALRTAHARLKDRDRSSLLLEENAAAAEAHAKTLEADLASEAAARAAASAAAEALEQELNKGKITWQLKEKLLAAEAAIMAEAGKKRAEELEGALSECKGRGEARTAKVHAAGIATGLCGLVTAAAYVHNLMQKHQIAHLKLESEKLRCAVAEAQGGVRQRMSRAGSAVRPAQETTAR